MLAVDTIVDSLIFLALPFLCAIDIHILILERVCQVPTRLSDMMAMGAVGVEVVLAAATLYSNLFVVGTAAPAARFVRELIANAISTDEVVLFVQINVKLSVLEALAAACKSLGVFGVALIALVASLMNVVLVIISWFPRVASVIVVLGFLLFSLE